MLSTARLVAFVASSDLDRSHHFYVEVLGLTVRDRTPYALVLDSVSTELRVTHVEHTVAAPYTVLGWSVDDLDESVAGLRDGGVVFSRYDGMQQDEHDAWTAPDGTRVAWFEDPDGNVLSLHQPG